MVIVGHDVDVNGRDYWIILNSHGVHYGEHGFLRIYVNVMDSFITLVGGLVPIKWKRGSRDHNKSLHR